MSNRGGLTMKRVSYCGESFLTTDAAADALLELVGSLHLDHNSEMLELPAVSRSGDPILVQLVVGPGSELISIPSNIGSVEPDTRIAVSYLQDRIDSLSLPRELAFSEALASAEYGWDESYTA
jgi:hypothetical protein